MVYYIVLAVFLLLAIMGEYLFVVVGGITIVSLYLVTKIGFPVIFGDFYKLGIAPILLAMPYFIFAGFILAASNFPRRLINFTDAVLGWLPGGFVMVVVISYTIFTPLSGASSITVVALGGILYEALLEKGYDEKFSLGLVTASGILGMILPPSLPVIFYGMTTQTNVESVYIAGLIPTFIMVVFFIIYAIWKTSRSQQTTKFSLRNLMTTTYDIIWEFPSIAIITVGGIYSGLLTASEAAVVLAFYVFIVEVFIKRDIKLNVLIKTIRESMIMLGALIMILGMALALTDFIVYMEIPMRLFAYLETHIVSKYLFLIIINVFLLVIAGTMDVFSAIIVVMPIIVPVALSFGLNPIHVAVMFLVNLSIGYITPPMGIDIFLAQLRFERPYVEVLASIVPFFIISLIVLAIVSYVPHISTYLLQFFHAKVAI